MLAAALLFVHLVSFAAYIRAGFAQTQLIRSSNPDREALAATIVTKIELPAILGSIASGVGFVVQNPAVMKFGWLHAKLLVVLLLALLSHAEMFNARAIVKLRAAGKSAEIGERKKRHALFGNIGALLVVVLLVLVTFVRLAM